jgi:hypothetical protein
MATIPTGQQFHTLAADVDTQNRGSATANADRTVYTMTDIINTVTGSVGDIGGSIADNQIAIGAATSNEIEGSDSLSFDGTDIVMPQYIRHKDSTTTLMGFSGANTWKVRADGEDRIIANETNVTLHYDGGATHLSTGVRGVVTYGQADLNALNTAPNSATDTGVLGEIRWAADYVYLCTATDTWVRAALATW